MLHSLDIRRALAFYMSRTKDFCTSSRLFVCFHGPRKGSPASSQTISRWIVSTITLAYGPAGKAPPEALKAQSTRGDFNCLIAWRWHFGHLPRSCMVHTVHLSNTRLSGPQSQEGCEFWKGCANFIAGVTGHLPVSELASHPFVCIHRAHEEERLLTCSHISSSGPLWIHRPRPSSLLSITLVLELCCY